MQEILNSKGIGDILTPVFLLLLFGIFFWWNRKPVDWTADEVRDLLNSWFKDCLDEARWDYFISCKISDPHLNKIRQLSIDIAQNSSLCDSVSSKLTKEGEESVRALLSNI